MFKTIMMAAAILFTFTSSSNAAEMTVRQSPKHTYIVIEGDIELKDGTKFAKVLATAGKKAVAVVLTSRGGSVVGGINIGLAVKQAGLKTIAHGKCVSICGAIWLAGKQRFVTGTTYVGFHGAYHADTGQPHAAANAILGAYLMHLGIGYDTIIFLTDAAADQMVYLTTPKAKEYGLPFSTIAD